MKEMREQMREMSAVIDGIRTEKDQKDEQILKMKRDIDELTKKI
jgi:uncharacterized coiled-coil DUF342 family protein